MRVLVTGALGFVGRWVCAELLAHGHEVVGATRAPGDLEAVSERWRERLRPVTWTVVDVTAEASIAAAVEREPDAVIHLAAAASGAFARSDPVAAWTTNCLGTCRLAYHIQEHRPNTRLVFASTGEVYGADLDRPATEDMPVRPSSPYAASKAGAELALLELHRRFGADIIIARAFQQTGPGQSREYVVPALAGGLLDARHRGNRHVTAGSLTPVREFIDVRDAAIAYRLILERGEAGGVYNIARGYGLSIREVLGALMVLVGWQCEVAEDPGLLRQGDIPYLVGDGARIAAMGWMPRLTLTDTLRDILGTFADSADAGQG